MRPVLSHRVGRIGLDGHRGQIDDRPVNVEKSHVNREVAVLHVKDTRAADPENEQHPDVSRQRGPAAKAKGLGGASVGDFEREYVTVDNRLRWSLLRSAAAGEQGRHKGGRECESFGPSHWARLATSWANSPESSSMGIPTTLVKLPSMRSTNASPAS